MAATMARKLAHEALSITADWLLPLQSILT